MARVPSTRLKNHIHYHKLRGDYCPGFRPNKARDGGYEPKRVPTFNKQPT
jgi:hypothetical protein